MYYRIIQYLLQKNANIDEFISTSQQNCYLDDCLTLSAKNLLNWNVSGIYHSKAEMSWVRFDFIQYSFFIEWISLFSENGNRDMINWKFEGSIDGSTFHTIYINNGEKLCTERLENGISCNGSQSKTYEIPSGLYKSIRMETTGVSSHNDYFFVLRGIEFIGWLDIPIIKSSCSPFIHFQLSIIFCFIILSLK